MTKKEIIDFSKKIVKKYGKNYYRATSLFPKKVREAVYVYYAWMRIADECVDGELSHFEAEQKLTAWEQDWNNSVSAGEHVSIHEYMSELFLHYSVPPQYAEGFLFAMKQDLFKKRYNTYEELEKYMHGSAVVVGLTMLCFFGLHRQDLIPGATKLGQAMQLANFLRDIREDYDDLGRIYLPQEDMARFGLSDNDIANHVLSDNFKKLMQFEIARCRELYAQAWPAIEKLPWRVKFPIRIATRNYEGVLSEIEKSDYDIWSTRHALPKRKKILIIIKSLFV